MGFARVGEQDPGAAGISDNADPRAARNRLYIDSLYEFLFTGAGKLAATALAFVVDTLWIDGVVNNVGRGMTLMSAGVRRVQTGYVRTYALGILAGGIVLLGLFVGRTH